MTASVAAALAYLSGFAITVVLAVTLAGAPVPPAVVVFGGLLPVVVPMALARTRRPAHEALVWQAFWGIGMACVVALACAGQLPERPYGDGDVFTQFVAEGKPMPRWLAGSAIAAWGHTAAWEFPPIASRLPATLATTSGYLSLVCALAVGIGTLCLIQKWPNRLAVLLPTITPVWLLFASGYVEYYPLVVPLYVAALAWLFESPLEQRTPTQIGVLAGALPCVYIAFAPAALIVLVTYALTRRAHALHAVAAALSTALVIVVACWPEGVPHFFRALYGVMNFGATGLPARYEGATAGAASILFDARAVFSPTHLGDVLYMTFWGGGWWTIPLLAWRRVIVTAFWPDTRTWLGAALLIWHMAYLTMMIPRLGPTNDIDLFFPCFLTVAFVAGTLLDTTPGPLSAARRQTLVAGALGASMGTAMYLAWLGIPVRL